MWKFVKSVLEKSSWLNEKTNIQVCFWGRSNVGKSSLLNALIGQNISYVSKRPGRTQLINYFNEDNNYIVDFPGYGYAQLSKDKIEHMNKCIKDFLKYEPNNKVIFLLIDSRAGITKLDLETIEFLKTLNWDFHVVYTKIDKLNQKEKSQLIKKHNQYLSDNLFKENTEAFLVSSEKKINIDELIEFIGTIFYQ
ncbi:ribosome biogenesis GTP-binding protein YihA/YsxC [Mycoplasmopsis felifaucium]|uniref:ribosome biogenesis GTP-binding protein YihA/YsxC n=1 Tax=Mycoplasmopsis felifaucium TaxID=35768 RepID=UPI000480FDF0|nr:ribosome biogenesis GTP-binding protein YihA/YsxC [Mycoplasmopsis felifaucium]